MASVALYGSGSQVSGTNDTDRGVTVTTAAGDLIVVIVTMTGQTSWTNIVVEDSLLGGTYSRVTGSGSVKASSADAAAIFVRNSLIASGGSCDIAADFQTGGVTHSGASVVALKVTGMARSGLGAIRQSAVANNQAGAATPTPVLSAAMLTGNAGIGYVHNATNPAGLTPRASWTELLDSGYGAPTTGVEVMARNSGETASSIAWGGTSASAYSAGVIELDATPLGTTYDDTITESVAMGESLSHTQTFVSALSEGPAVAFTMAESGGASTFNETLTEAIESGVSLASAHVMPNALSASFTAAVSLSAPYTLNINSFGFRSLQWSLRKPAMVSRSGWTGARTVVAMPWHSKWMARVELAQLQGESAVSRLRAFLGQRQGKIAPFRLYATTEAQNANSGVTVSSTAAQGATSLVLSGAATPLTDGQFATVNGQLLCLTQDQSGSTITFEPGLRQQAAAGTSVNTHRPYALVHLSASSVQWSVTPNRMFNCAFDCEEAMLEDDVSA